MKLALLLVTCAALTEKTLGSKGTTSKPSDYLTEGVQQLINGMRPVDGIRLTSVTANLPGVGVFQVGAFTFSAAALAWVGGLEMPADGTQLTFRAKLSHFMSGYNEVRLTVGELSETYRVVGSVRDHSVQVRLSLSDCTAEVEDVHLIGPRLQVVGEGRLRELARVLTGWLEEDYWTKLEGGAKKALDEMLKEPMRRSSLCHLH